MDFRELIHSYNNKKIDLETLIFSLLSKCGESSNKGVIYWFSKDIIIKNGQVRPISVIKKDNVYMFTANNNELFRITERSYDKLNSNVSPLRASLFPFIEEKTKTYIFSNDQFELGRHGLYEDINRKDDFTKYRYIAIKIDKKIHYEAYIDKTAGTYKKSYMDNYNEIERHFTYDIKKKDVSNEDIVGAITKIKDFLQKEYPELNGDDYSRYFNDIGDQFYYDIAIIDKKDRYKDIYITNRAIMDIEVPSDNGVTEGLTIKGNNTKAMEDYLTLSNNHLGYIKLLTVSDFVNGYRFGKDIREYINKELQDWFNALEVAKIRNDQYIINSLSNKLITLNKSLSDEAYESKLITERRIGKVIGSALGIALISLDDTYVINYGDTRIYTMKDNDLNQITIDDTSVWDLYKEGKITKDKALEHKRSTTLTNYIGHPIKYIERPNIYKISNNTYDKLFILSDGVTENIDESRIVDINKLYRESDILKEIVFSAYHKQDKHDDVTGCCYIKRKI